jgi:hypothetical protein
METVTLNQVEVSPVLARNPHLAQLQVPPEGTQDAAGSVVWADLIETLNSTNELSRLARALAE